MIWPADSKGWHKTKPFEFECPKDPIKFLAIYLSHDVAGNDENFLYQNKKNGSKARDLTLFGRKSLGLSQLTYIASMLSVPETVIRNTADASPKKLFAFLWKNKTD